MSTITAKNGIDVDRLISTIEAIGNQGELASFTFRAKSSWVDGTHNRGSITGFVHAGSEDTSRTDEFALEGDEPPILLGNNQGPNAVELLLQALAFCYAVGFVANAAARGIEVTSMDYEIEGDLDVRSFLGMDGPRAGFTQIRAVGIVSSPNASEEQLEELFQYVQQTSPVRDCLANHIPVETTLRVA